MVNSDKTVSILGMYSENKTLTDRWESFVTLTYIGVGLENKGHQGSHFFNSKGVLLRHVQLQLRKGIKFIFVLIKELRG